MEGNVVPVLLKYGARVNDQDGVSNVLEFFACVHVR